MALGRIHDSPTPALPEPLRLVVAGEFSSGKSTAINAVLRHRLLPSAFGGLKAPPIRVRHGDAFAVSYPALDGSQRPADSILDAIETGVASEIHVTVPFPALKGVELIEVPARPDGVWDDEARALVASADMLIWCSISSQAWRLSEKAFIEDLPRGLRARSVLLLSRADKLRSNADCDKIMRRLEREAASFFANVIFMGGAPDLIEASSRDETAWADTGGKYILDLAQELFGAKGEAVTAPFPAVDSPALPRQVPDIDRKLSAPAPQPLPDLPPPVQWVQAATPPDGGEPETEETANPAPSPLNTETPPVEPQASAPEAQVVIFKPHHRDTPRAEAPDPSAQATFRHSAPRAPEAEAPVEPAATPDSEAAQLLSDLDGVLAAGVAVTATGGLAHCYHGAETEARSLGAAAALILSTQARAMQLLGQSEPTDEMLLTYATNALLIRPLAEDRFIFALLRREKSNIPMARVALRDVADILEQAAGPAA